MSDQPTPLPPERKIVAAAIRHGGKLYTGLSHSQVMNQIYTELGRTCFIPQTEQGFITDRGEFLNRFQAGAVAFRAGQTKTRKETLLSEHLW